MTSFESMILGLSRILYPITRTPAATKGAMKALGLEDINSGNQASARSDSIDGDTISVHMHFIFPYRTIMSQSSMLVKVGVA